MKKLNYLLFALLLTVFIGSTSCENDPFAPHCGTIGCVSPTNHFEVYFIDDYAKIKWYTGNDQGIVNIYLQRDYPDGEEELLFEHIPNNGEVTWKVTEPETNHAVFIVKCANSEDNFEISTYPFNILEDLVCGNGETP